MTHVSEIAALTIGTKLRISVTRTSDVSRINTNGKHISSYYSVILSRLVPIGTESNRLTEVGVNLVRTNKNFRDIVAVCDKYSGNGAMLYTKTVTLINSYDCIPSIAPDYTNTTFVREIPGAVIYKLINNMRKVFETLNPEDRAGLVQLTTTHSACNKLYTKYGNHIKLKGEVVLDASNHIAGEALALSAKLESYGGWWLDTSPSDMIYYNKLRALAISLGTERPVPRAYTEEEIEYAR